MTVERVRITPTQITLKDSNSKIIFDTNNQYIRTEPNGNLRLNTQMPAVRFTTYGGQVQATNNLGVVLGYRSQYDLTVVAQSANARFPEFTGSLIVTTSQYNDAVSNNPVFVGIYRLVVSINGVPTVSTMGQYPTTRQVFFGGGGGIVVPVFNNTGVWRWDNLSPGTLVEFGPVYRLDPNGNPIGGPVTASQPGGGSTIYTALAIQSGISSLPLTVTP
jgi:hypothetical protein